MYFFAGPDGFRRAASMIWYRNEIVRAQLWTAKNGWKTILFFAYLNNYSARSWGTTLRTKIFGNDCRTVLTRASLERVFFAFCFFGSVSSVHRSRRGRLARTATVVVCTTKLYFVPAHVYTIYARSTSKKQYQTCRKQKNDAIIRLRKACNTINQFFRRKRVRRPREYIYTHESLYTCYYIRIRFHPIATNLITSARAWPAIEKYKDEFE